MTNRNTGVQSLAYSKKANLDKRKGDSPIPLNLKHYLSSEQIKSVRHMEVFGWQLKFVRRSSGTPVVVVSSKETMAYAVLEQDGTINTHIDLVIR